MIATLYISNYALIDRLEITFGPGLNIVTGETGAGKSIVLDALGLLMGERADTKTIRDTEKKTVVEAHFEVSGFDSLNRWLEENDIDGGDECILRREISAKGSSRAFINDTPVNLPLMKAVSSKLLDIHTQHENVLLLDSEFQLAVIDSLARNSDLLDEYKAVFHEYKKKLKEYTLTRDNLKKAKAESEYNDYLLEQLENLNLKPGEQARLEQERDILANAAEIKTHLTAALDVLSRSEKNVLGILSVGEDEINRLSRFVPDMSLLADRLSGTRIEIADIVDTLEEYDNTISASQSDLDETERRLGEIYSLQARHNVKTEDELIAVREKLLTTRNDVENSALILEKLEKDARELKKKAVGLARMLTNSRSEVARIFADELKERGIPLGMKNLRCEIRVVTDKLGETGADQVEFLFAFNKNQTLMPVGKTASGGEISRVILALKSLLVEKMKLPTIIFDEVDTGVSGDVANKMADLMVEISGSTQVITITHIAAVAARGTRHFKVYKRDENDSTHTYIKQLNKQERERELAVMISGKPDDVNAIETAKALLDK